MQLLMQDRHWDEIPIADCEFTVSLRFHNFIFGIRLFVDTQPFAKLMLHLLFKKVIMQPNTLGSYILDYLKQLE